METMLGLLVLAAIAWWFYKSGKRIGSRKGYNVGNYEIHPKLPRPPGQKMAPAAVLRPVHARLRVELKRLSAWLEANEWRFVNSCVCHQQQLLCHGTAGELARGLLL